MKKQVIFSILASVVVIFSAFTVGEKLTSKKTNIKFFSSTQAEDITANNYASVSTFDPKTGDVIFSVPMQSFEFEKRLMQKHFNQEKFLDTQKHPKAKFKGKVTNLKDINFSKDGTYKAIVEGDLTIKGETKFIKDEGTIKITGEKLIIDTKFNVKLADFGVAFEKGKPSTNIAETVEVTVYAEY